MKKLIAIILTLAMLASLAACTDKTEEKEETTALATQESSSEESTDPSSEEIEASAYAYVNEELGIACTLDSDWVISSDEELAAMLGLSVDMFKSTALAEAVDVSGVAIVFNAMLDDGIYSINVTMESIKGKNINDVQDYIDANLLVLAPALENAGLANVTATTVPVTFAGQDMDAIQVYGEAGGMAFNEKLVVLVSGDYGYCITFTCIGEDVTEEMLTTFTVY